MCCNTEESIESIGVGLSRLVCRRAQPQPTISLKRRRRERVVHSIELADFGNALSIFIVLSSTSIPPPLIQFQSLGEVALLLVGCLETTVHILQEHGVPVVANE